MACFQAGGWLFVEPRDGLRVFNRASGHEWLFANGWQSCAAISDPAGGATVDAEARATISAMLGALRTAGLLPPSP